MILMITKTILLAYVLTGFAPIQWIIDTLPNNLIKYILVVLTSCLKCASLWIGIFIFGFWIGIIGSVSASILTEIKNIYYRWLNK